MTPGGTTAPHVVGRLALRAAIADREAALAIRPRLEALARSRLPAAVERVADQLRVGARHLAIGRLDLDLGRIAPHTLEADLTDAFERALSEALADALVRARFAPSAEARLVEAPAALLGRFEDFLATGLMPPAERAPARAIFRRLAADDPGALVAMLRRARRRPRVPDRLVLQLGAEGFAELVALLAPGDAATILALLADVILAHRIAPAPPAPLAEPALDHLLRVATVEFLLVDRGNQFNRRRYLDYLLRREAARAHVDADRLFDLLADAVSSARTRAGFRSSLPVVLAELLARRRPPLEPEPVAAGGDPWRLARRGVFGPLAGVARAAGDQPLRALAGRLDRPLFVGLVGELEPAGRPAIVAMVDRLVAANRIDPHLAPDGVERALRHLTLRFLLRDPGTAFNRRRFLAYLLRHEAARAGFAEPALRAALARTLARWDNRARLAVTLAELVAEEGGGASTTRPLPRTSLDVARSIADARAGGAPPDAATIVARLDGGRAEAILAAMPASRFARWLLAAGGEAAPAIARDVERLRAAHAATPFGDVPDGAFERVLRLAAAAIAASPGETAARRRKRLATLIARRLVTPAGPLLAALATSPAEAAAERLAAAPRLRRAERIALLRAIDRRNADRIVTAIDALVRRHRTRALVGLSGAEFAARAWSLAAAHLAGPGGFDADRFAATLAEGFARTARAAPPPSEAATRAPGGTTDATLAGELARAAPNLRRATSPLSEAATRVPGGAADATPAEELARAAPDPRRAALPSSKAAARAAGGAADRLALLACWLDHGTFPGWAPVGLTPRALLAASATLPATALRALFTRPGRATARARLVRAAGVLDEAAQRRLLIRLVPALAAGGRLSRMVAALPAGTRDPTRIDVAAATLTGRPPAPPQAVRAVARPRAAAPPRRGDTPAEVERLFAWLGGASASAGEAAALARVLARLADRGDGRLLATVAAHRRDAATLDRWAAMLPMEGLARIVHRLDPAGAATLLAVARLLAGLAAPTRAFARALLAVAAARSDAATAATAMIAALAPVDAATLRRKARRRAERSGAADLAAALDAGEDDRPRVPPPPDDPPDAPDAPDPADPDRPLYPANAGLVLLAPYLPTLFDRLGLLAPDADGVPRVPAGEARSLAVHLLQYCVDGRLDAPEPQLALNKLLCGLPLAEPVADRVGPDPALLATCDGLLAAVIANWPALGNASVAALRETFLQREGRLARTDGGWALAVQRRGALDALVDRVPWSLSPVFHRWMARPVTVTW